MENIRDRIARLPRPDAAAVDAAAARQAELTKPAGSLGRLEDIVLWLAGWQGKHPPTLARPHVLVFAGNHGVTARGVSAFPADVTAQMVANFEAGGAAINALSRNAGASFAVVPVSLDTPTADFTQAPAMTEAELAAAFEIGARSVPETCDILLLGEMGIGNTTAAAALARALFGGTAADWVGTGTGIDDAGLARKQATVDAAIAYHAGALADPLEALRRVGGRELAAIAGACLQARHRRIPVLLDGYVSTAAAAALTVLDPSALDHCQIGHASAEPGHRRLLDRLNKRALLDLDMRLGEASGAAVALCVVQAALAAHLGMATFTEAGVAGKSVRD